MIDSDKNQRVLISYPAIT